MNIKIYANGLQNFDIHFWIVIRHQCTLNLSAADTTEMRNQEKVESLALCGYLSHALKVAE